MSRVRAPSIIASTHGSAQRSVFGKPPRHEGDGKTACVDGDPKAPKSGEHKIWGLTFWIAVFSHNGALTAGSLLPAMKASCVRGLRRVTRRAGAQRRSRRAA